MNKYEKAIDDVSSYCSDYRLGMKKPTKELTNELDILNELVERATPKKPNIEMMVDDYEENGYIKSFLHQKIECPICRTVLEDEADCIDLVGWKHCPTCGQALDWSEEDD